MIVLRPATLDDVPLLDLWDLEPDVISATSDDPDAPKGFGDIYWPGELALVRHDYQYFIAELDEKVNALRSRYGATPVDLGFGVDTGGNAVHPIMAG